MSHWQNPESCVYITINKPSVPVEHCIISVTECISKTVSTMKTKDHNATVTDLLPGKEYEISAICESGCKRSKPCMATKTIKTGN